jgi:hypothetical protein
MSFESVSPYRRKARIGSTRARCAVKRILSSGRALAILGLFATGLVARSRKVLLATWVFLVVIIRGLKAHGVKTRPLRFCGSDGPKEGETGLHTAQFWTPDNTSSRESRMACTTDTSTGNHNPARSFGGRLSTHCGRST